MISSFFEKVDQVDSQVAKLTTRSDASENQETTETDPEHEQLVAPTPISHPTLQTLESPALDEISPSPLPVSDETPISEPEAAKNEET